METHILGHIRELIPSGVGKNHDKSLPQAIEFMNENGPPPGTVSSTNLANRQGLLTSQRQSLTQRARTQFGTLGSGNHFVEVCEDTDGSVWLLLHSGSRGIGNMLATAHVKVAKAFCERTGIAVEDRDFAYVMSGDERLTHTSQTCSGASTTPSCSARR